MLPAPPSEPTDPDLTGGGQSDPQPVDLEQDQPLALEYAPGLVDIEAAVGLVSAGLATKVVLANFPSWPGLLWRAYQLAEEADVQIMPTVVRPGGRVDIVVMSAVREDRDE